MSYEQSLAEDLRLRALMLLTELPAWSGNEMALARLLAERWGHAISGDRLRAELAWLDEQGLLTVQKPGGVWLATLSARGMDAARGLASVPGVARPRPGEL